MKSKKYIKKKLKKIYEESIIKKTLPYNSLNSSYKATLICYLQTVVKYNPKTFNYRCFDAYEICQFYHDTYNGESDSWDISDSLIKQNKKIPYPKNTKRVRKGLLKFTYLEC